MLEPGDVPSVVAPATPDAMPTVLGSSYRFIEHIHETRSRHRLILDTGRGGRFQAGMEVAP